MAHKYGITELMSKLIINRDITDDFLIRSYIKPEFNMLHEPRDMKDMNKAVEIIINKIKNKIK